jgi:hypothetical protein
MTWILDLLAVSLVKNRIQHATTCSPAHDFYRTRE